ncbi:YcjF family protein [Skermanella sp. TT6]|nr:DUF697 domain-containing protein [Skermanella sp. TT6]
MRRGGTQATERVMSNERITDANKLVSRYALWAAGGGLIPVPTLDIAAIVAVQIKMVSDLSKLYGVPFSQDRAKTVVSALIGGVLPGALAGGSLAVLGTVIKLIPIVGTAVGMAVSSGFAYALTQAVGKVFVLHYETGGSLLNFEPEKVRSHFEKEFKGAQAAPETPVAA